MGPSLRLRFTTTNTGTVVRLSHELYLYTMYYTIYSSTGVSYEKHYLRVWSKHLFNWMETFLKERDYPMIRDFASRPRPTDVDGNAPFQAQEFQTYINPC